MPIFHPPSILRDSSENSPLWLKSSTGTFARAVDVFRWGLISQRITVDGTAGAGTH